MADFRARGNYAGTFPTSLPDDAYCDNWLARNGLDLLRAAPADKPWHLAVNFAGPHEPMDITASMEKRWRRIAFPQPNRNTAFPRETHVAIRQNYAAMIENIDRWAGTFLEEVPRRGRIGQHHRGLVERPWRDAGRPRPLGEERALSAVAGSAAGGDGAGCLRGGCRCPAATFLEYAGLPAPRNMDSRSLRPLLEGRTKRHREYVLAGLGKWRMAGTSSSQASTKGRSLPRANRDRSSG